jgi:hypothetical protein
MCDRRLRFILLGLLGLLAVACIVAPGVTQAPGSGSVGPSSTGALAGPSSLPVPIHVHIHNNTSPYDPWLYGYNPFGQRFDSLTEYRRQQLENFYNYSRGNMAQLNRMQAEDVGLPSPREDMTLGEKVEQLNKVMAPGRIADDELNRSTGKIRWPGLLQKPEYAVYREKLEALFKTWATSPNTGYGSDNYHRIQVAASLLYEQLSMDVKVQVPFQMKPYIYAEMFARQLAYEAGFRPKSAGGSGPN